MNEPHYFEIQATTPSALVEFYGSVFGWSFEQDEGLPIEYWRIVTDGMHGAILARPAPVPDPGQGTNAYVVSMEVADFDATASRISDGGGIVAMPKFAVPGRCWQGYFVDPDNNTFGIFQADENAA